MACCERSHVLWLSVRVNPYKLRVIWQPFYISRPHSYPFHAQSQFLSSYSIQKGFRWNLTLFDIFCPFWPLDRISAILLIPHQAPYPAKHVVQSLDYLKVS